MDSPNNLADEKTRTSFQQFFGTTANPILGSNVAYSPTNRKSDGKEKEHLMSEVRYLSVSFDFILLIIIHISLYID